VLFHPVEGEPEKITIEPGLITDDGFSGKGALKDSDGNVLIVSKDSVDVSAFAQDLVVSRRSTEGRLEYIICDLESAEVHTVIRMPGTGADTEPGDTPFNPLNVVIIVVIVLVLIFWRQQEALSGPVKLPASTMPASIVRRLTAFVIDFLPGIILVTVIWGIDVWHDVWKLDRFLSFAFQGNVPQDFLQQILALGITVVYMAVLEVFFGFTPGKKICGISIITDEGESPTVRQMTIRNVVRIAEFLFPPILLLALFAPAHQRLGDVLARTVVVKRQDNV
jgi:uncharacterized RDD family membrane protein YckC